MEQLLHSGSGGETLAEGQLRTTQEDIAEFFQALNAARVVFEVGTHSPWVQEVICGCGHEVLVANPRLMEGSKRRKRKNDRIDANKLARLGRVDPKSLHPIQHRSREVRQDLVVLRARDALVAARTELINAMQDLGGELTIKSQLDHEGRALISVSDSGVGLPAEKGDQIFSAFFTTKTAGLRHGSGNQPFDRQSLMVAVCGQYPTPDEVQLFTSPCRNRCTLPLFRLVEAPRKKRRWSRF